MKSLAALLALLAALAAPVSADAFARPSTVLGAKIVRAACPTASAAAAGCYAPDGTIYIAPEDDDAEVRAHELGHLYDARYLDDRERAAFQRLVNRPGPWIPEGDTESDAFHARAPVEVFADRYAHCRIDGRADLYWSTPGLRLFEGEHRRTVCAMIARARFTFR